MRRLGTIFLLFLALTASSLAAPEVLIVQLRAPVGDDDDPNVGILNALAQELDDEGRVVPIAWTLSDPIFRGAYEAKTVTGDPANPTEEQALRGAEALRVGWILFVSAERKGGQLGAKARLFKRGADKAAWSDEKLISVTVGATADFNSSAATLARTWAALLSEGPFRQYPARPRVATPNPDDGRGGTASSPPAIDDTYRSRAQQLIKQGMVTEAINLLRDAVDADPMDASRREELARALLQQGFAQEAATEATRASQMAPDRNDLRFVAVQAWIGLDRPDEANKVLNEALARDPGNPQTLILVGDVALAKGDPGKAVEAYSRSIRIEDTFEARLGRACAYGASGWPEPCAADIAALTPERVASGYPRVVAELERALQFVAGEVREIVRAARLSPRQKATIDRASRVQRAAAGLARLAAAYPAPAKYRESYARRDLAHNLLQQSCLEALEFARTGVEDVASEATISLGEALKQFQSIREMYLKESAK
ncbi:MAG TPA: tetratricopeptide repeat protein [Fimbriimonadaceae bacterium]|nr:tetratricopeptide repeat protein [Fimbriimonadaceae bacterium]